MVTSNDAATLAELKNLLNNFTNKYIKAKIEDLGTDAFSLTFETRTKTRAYTIEMIFTANAVGLSIDRIRGNNIIDCRFDSGLTSLSKVIWLNTRP